jgi:molybdate transport system substrate-binding protein
MKSNLAVFALVAVALGASQGARAESEITLLSPNPIKAEVDKIVANFQAKTGTKVTIAYGTGVGTRKIVASGQGMDVTLLFAPFDDALKPGNNLVPSTATVVARVRLAIAVKKGTPAPDISNAAAVRATLTNAKSIISVDPAEGSVVGAVLLALNKMGIANQVEQRIKWVRGGDDVQTAVAKGEYEIALGPYLSDIRNPGLDVVGALPPEAATPVDITGFLSTAVKDPNAAKALLAYMSSEDAAPVWRAAKIFPVR